MMRKMINKKSIVVVFLGLILLVPADPVGAGEGDQGTDGMNREGVSRQMVGLGLSRTDADGLATALSSAGFRGEDVNQVLNQLRMVSNDQITLTLMIQKVHEGIAKKATAEGVVRAVTRVRQRQEMARSTEKGLALQHEGALRPIIADALVSGLRQEELSQVTKGLETRNPNLGKEQFAALATATLLTVRDMVRYGVESTTASSVATQALSLGYGAEEMHILRQLINDQPLQADMETVCQRMLKGLNQGVGAGDMRGFALGAQKGSSAGKKGNGSGGGSGSGHGSGGSGHGGSGGHGGGSGGSGHGGGR